ncbi:LytTR family DNA-binding domain-containing protein [Gallaecimonas kandeliae]|uniref:LytR/AlgR family response regulator transcription factor n=1 Tax=Gallaecimonas kandeliae TaxID=3029055 RepID=UPI0026496639|nr:LytTR family DNA-binding domain-containing protein [Gallaecimonas kandeliae]WKE67158.1 LytTR family DNA-binding domain-containing protein [Gallaecimonas kandeliae]
MTIRTLIVDDEPLARQGLKLRLADYPALTLVGEASSAKEALQSIVALKPDLVFLDIQMPGMSGIELLESLVEKDLDLPLVVFVTAYDDYAVKAFELHALDYLLKPVDGERLKDCLERIGSQLEQRDQARREARMLKALAELAGVSMDEVQQRLSRGEAVTGDYASQLAIRDGSEVSLVAVADIDWVDAAGDYMCIHAKGVTHIMRKTMKELEAMLDPRRFVRIHRSAIVNRERIGQLINLASADYLVRLKSGDELRVGRSYREKVKQLLL